MLHRIVQWGTGNVGRHALRAIIERPDFELVGLRVYNPDKVGQDAGALLGRDPVGVIATDDTDAIIALDADCVCYTALGSTLESAEGPLDDICRLLASGKNVVSSAVEFHAYFRPDFQPPGAGERAFERLSDACAKGNTSFFHTGINPGFTMDLWPIFMSRLSRRIDRIRVTEIVEMGGYPSIHMVRDAIGFGLPPDQPSLVDERNQNVRESAFYISMRLVADSLGLTIDDVRYHREVAVTDRPLQIAAGTIEAGTVAAMKMVFEGYALGRPLIVLELVWRVSADIGVDWASGASRWILRVDGDPTIDSEIVLATAEDAGRATSLAVATLLLNAVPTVVAAPPGLLDNLTIPTHGGGCVLPS